MMASELRRKLLTGLVVFVTLLTACSNDPNAAYFALESELVDQVEPHGQDPEKARAALCKWFREEGPRIREIQNALSESMNSGGREARAPRKEMQMAHAARFSRVVNPLLSDDRFVTVLMWFDSEENADLDEACKAP